MNAFNVRKWKETPKPKVELKPDVQAGDIKTESDKEADNENA